MVYSFVIPKMIVCDACFLYLNIWSHFLVSALLCKMPAELNMTSCTTLCFPQFPSTNNGSDLQFI